jgi:hypothetical protein
MNKLKPEIKSKWVAALRSNEYTQIRGKLRSQDNPSGMCAIGVLCHISPEVVKFTSAGCPVAPDGSTDVGKFLPTHLVLEAHGISPDNTHTIRAQIVLLNDAKMKSFPEIANWIEENL